MTLALILKSLLRSNCSAPARRLAAHEVCIRLGCGIVAVGGLQASCCDDGVHLNIPDRRTGGPLHRRLEEAVCPALGHPV
jgi:hypothetical protein